MAKLLSEAVAAREAAATIDVAQDVGDSEHTRGACARLAAMNGSMQSLAWHRLAKLGPNSAQSRPHLADLRAMSCRPRSAEIGHSIEIGQIWLTPGKTLSSLAARARKMVECWPISAGFGQKRWSSEQVWATSGRSRSKLAQVGRFRADLG